MGPGGFRPGRCSPKDVTPGAQGQACPGGFGSRPWGAAALLHPILSRPHMAGQAAGGAGTQGPLPPHPILGHAVSKNPTPSPPGAGRMWNKLHVRQVGIPPACLVPLKRIRGFGLMAGQALLSLVMKTVTFENSAKA